MDDKRAEARVRSVHHDVKWGSVPDSVSSNCKSESPHRRVGKRMLPLSKVKDLDSPIVPVLQLMNKLGYATVASCCGYDYPGGAKDHSSTAYVYFTAPFSKIKKLRKDLHYWDLEYLGENGWVLRATYTGVEGVLTWPYLYAKLRGIQNDLHK